MSRNLSEWLTYQENQWPGIGRGLANMQRLSKALGLLPPDYRVITIGGTNGKGSTAHLLDAIYREAGYRTGLYTSPHLYHYCERIQCNGQLIPEDNLVRIFERIEQAAEGVPLRYFEWGTLAAFCYFKEQQIDLAILEVGLGGRLDCVNVIDPDCAIITSVGLDHQDILGPDRAGIGFEKAGIFRPDKPAICGDPDPPLSVLQAPCAGLRLQKRDFEASAALQQAQPHIHPHNLGTACAAVEVMQAFLPVTPFQLMEALRHPVCPLGRHMAVLSPCRQIPLLLDVAHNPDSAEYLAETLKKIWGETLKESAGLFGIMHNKDIEGTLKPLLPWITRWYLTDLPTPRAASAVEIKAILEQKLAVSREAIHTFPDPLAALAAAENAGDMKRIVAWGSFLTVGPIGECLLS